MHKGMSVEEAWDCTETPLVNEVLLKKYGKKLVQVPFKSRGYWQMREQVWAIQERLA